MFPITLPTSNPISYKIFFVNSHTSPVGNQKLWALDSIFYHHDQGINNLAWAEKGDFLENFCLRELIDYIVAILIQRLKLSCVLGLNGLKNWRALPITNKCPLVVRISSLLLRNTSCSLHKCLSCRCPCPHLIPTCTSWSIYCFAHPTSLFFGTPNGNATSEVREFLIERRCQRKNENTKR